MGWSELAATSSNVTSGAITADNDIRVVSVTIAAYDYLATLPAAYRFYRCSNRQSSGLILFVLIRYTSIIVLVVSNVGFFYRGFTPKACENFHLVVPSLKVIQSMVSQAILAIRTYNISRRRPWVGRILLFLYIIATLFQWFSSLFSRMPTLIAGSCTSASIHPQRAISTWLFYLVAMLFDFLTLSISAFYLMKARAVTFSDSALKLVKIIFYDGLGYFVALTLMNAANIFLFRGALHAIQTSGASLGYSITWIMSQRILIHLHEASVVHKSVVVGNLPTPLAIMSTPLFVAETKHKTTIRGEPGSPDERSDMVGNFDLRVRVESSTVVNGEPKDKDSKAKDSDGSSKTTWEQDSNV